MISIKEDQITSTWGKNPGAPKVSVCCISYNHEKYLHESLGAIVQQVTTFPFEIIVHDDCSTDRSRSIIDSFAGRYPLLVKKVYQNENIYSQGQRPLAHVLKAASGDYVAICEGDDYWIDKEKLQIQFDALSQHPETNLAFHPAYTLIDGKVLDKDYGFYGRESQIHSVTDIIDVSGGYMPMASIFFRRKVFEKLFEEHNYFALTLLRHSALQILASLHGGALYIPRYMSVYRSMHEGSWSKLTSNSSEAKTESLQEFLLRNRELNSITEHKFSTNFNRVLLRRLKLFFMSKNVHFEHKLRFCKLFFKRRITSK